MIYYYLFMGLLILTLVLWTIIALREDSDIDEDEDTE
jgi:hypothetical protein